MKNVEIQIQYASFPNQFATDAEKETIEYGLQVGQAIQYEWFRKGGSSCRYYSQLQSFNELRRYARGEQAIGKYKNELAIDGDLSYLNLDWTPVPILPKFVDIVVNGMSNRLFHVKAYAQDALSSSHRNEYQRLVERDMLNKDIFSDFQESFGMNPFMTDVEDLPENNEELQLHMQLKYKPAIEVAEEEAINTVFEENHYLDIKKRIDYDMTVLGVGMAKHQFLPGSGVQVDYVDPANVVYSYTEDPHFKDCFYWGEIKTLPIAELIKIDPTLTNEDLKKISHYSQSWYDYYNVNRFYDNTLFNKDSATLIYFNYKTTKKFVYKNKKLDNGGERIIEKDETFNPPQEMMDEGNFERIEKTIEVWYEGIMVAGSNIMLKWELAHNMVRPKSASQHAMPNYVACAPRMYKGTIESLVRRMIPFADQIQITHLKLQQVVAKMVPDGVFIDADGLNEIDLGTGAAYNPEDALRLYFQTGSVVGRSYTQDGEFNNARVPIQQLNTSSGQSKMAALIGNYNHYLGMIRAVTGLNEARDGSTPDPNALVGVQKLAALNSNTATRHILEGGLYITRTLAECLSLRIADLLEYAPFKEEFANQIGKYNVDKIEEIKDLYLYDFGIFIEVSPDEEEKAMLEQNIQMALSKNDISLEDAIDIREVRNLKMANQLLKLKRKRKQDADREAAAMAQQMTAQTQFQSQQIAAQNAAQQTQLEGEMKMREEQAKIAFEIEKLKNEAALKQELMTYEFQLNMRLKGMEQFQLNDREEKREEAKSKRISQQNTEQSQLINQRKKDLPPINFESKEDSLDGFDLAEFEPR
tara:strand:+ start:975 stop:3410 length:2436 start_codon:yes stop_codon:yes gene_type:complete